MAGTLYDVVAQIRVQKPDMGPVKRELTLLDAFAAAKSQGIKGSLLSAFSGFLPGGPIVQGIALVGTTLVGVITGLSTAAVKFGGEVEQNRNQLVGLLNSVGGFSLEDSLFNADVVLQRLTDHAAHGSGAVADYIKTWADLAQVMDQTGASLEDLDKLTPLAIAAANATGIELGSAGEQIRRAIQESANSETRLVNSALGAAGVSKDDFNKLSDDKQLAVLKDAFTKFEGAAALAGQSFDAQWSTLLDTMKQIATELLAPTFDVLKEVLGDVNEGLGGENTDTLKSGARLVGEALALLVSPLRLVGGLFSTVGDFMARFPNLTDDLANAWAWVADAFNSLGTRLAEVFGPLFGWLVAFRWEEFQQNFTYLGELLSGTVRAFESVIVVAQGVGVALAELVKLIAGWVGFNGFGEADFSKVGKFLGTELDKVWTFERRQREQDADAYREHDAKERAKDRKKKSEVKVKVEAQINWNDNESVAVTIASAVEQALTQLAENPRESAFALQGA